VRFFPPHFAVAGLCYTKPLFATAKRQLPRTLCEIGANGAKLSRCMRKYTLKHS